MGRAEWAGNREEGRRGRLEGACMQPVLAPRPACE